jgi:hypothetical protein
MRGIPRPCSEGQRDELARFVPVLWLAELRRGLLGALTSMNIAKEEAAYLEQEIKTDHAIVTVQVDTRWSKAIDLLHRGGAYHSGTSRDIRAAQGDT